MAKYVNPKKQAEADVVAAAKKLDPEDQSIEAQQLRETAEDILDHQSSEAFKSDGSN